MFIQPGRPASPGPWGGLDYHSVNWCNYNCNTWLRRSRPAVCLHSTATTRKLYLKRIEVFFFSSSLSITVIYPLSKNKMLATPSMVGCRSGGCRYLIRSSWQVSVTHSHSWGRKVWWESLSGQEPKNYPGRAGTQVFSASPPWDLFIMVIGQIGGP